MKLYMIALPLLAAAGQAMGNDALIVFNSEITIAPCTIDASSKNQSIELPPLGTSDITQSSGVTPIDIALSDCNSKEGAPTVSTVAISFTADMIATGPLSGALVNHGTSPNVAVQLLDDGDNVVRPDGITATTFEIGVGEHVLPVINFRLVSDGPPIAGTINSSVTANFSYN